MSNARRPLVAFVGDDFTGSTDALESLTTAGLRTRLFTRVPSELPQDIDAFGIATTTRSMSPTDMARTLRPLFESIKRLQPRVVHYKVCSTFDSSPTVGSIGCAIDVGADVFDNRDVPVIAGAPSLGRYCVFGNLFARFGQAGEMFRLDRHPSMSRHPVTPMTEADLRIHLAKQTTKRIGLVDVTQLAEGEWAAIAAYKETAADVVLIDLCDATQLATVGGVLVSDMNVSTRYVVGSSGVGAALAARWKADGTISPESHSISAAARSVSPIVVISGSCSPVTGKQIGWACDNGFAEISLDTPAIATESDDERSAAERAIASAVASAVDAVRAGRSVAVHASRGPDDPRVAACRQTVSQDADRRIGSALGRILRAIVERTPVRRAVIAGGDTSGRIAAEIGVESMQMVASLVRGAPICRVSAPGSPANELEVTFKGGQVGPENVFGLARDGS